MGTLKSKAESILNEKDTKITTGNIKSGVEVFDIVGEYEGEPLSVVNGIVKQYKAKTSTINANTFVELVNDTTISSVKDSVTFARAVLVDTNKVMVIYKGTNNYLYGVICTIDDITITVGEEVLLVEKTSSYDRANICLLDTNKVFVIYNDGSYHIGGVVCNISNMTITPGTPTLINDTNNALLYSSVISLNSNKVFIYCGTKIEGSNTMYIGGFICEINGTAITHGDYYNLRNTSSISGGKPVKLAEDKVLLIGVDSNVAIAVCTISGTTISVGNFTELSGGETRSDCQLDAVALDNNKVFIAYQQNYSYYINGRVISVSDTSVSLGEKTYIYNQASSHISVCLLETNKVLVVHKNYDSSKLNGVVCTVNNTDVSFGTDYTISKVPNSSGSITTAIKITPNKVFIVHPSDYNNFTNGIICDIENTDIIIPAILKPAEDKIEGVTRTQCTTSTAGDVIILNEDI